MKIIKSLAMYVLFANVAYSADLLELPEDHPIKTAVQMAKFAFVQHPGAWHVLINANADHLRSNLSLSHFKEIEKTALCSLKECIDKLYFSYNLENIFLIVPHFAASMEKNYKNGGGNICYNISEILDTITSELDTYIDQSFGKHFTLRKDKGEFASAYKLALIYRDANTTHAENTAKANTWITEIQAKATAEIEEIGNVIYALFLEKNLQIKQHMKAMRIIDSFKMVDADFHGQLNAHFDSIVNKEPPVVPFAAERLIIYREIADKLFRKKDEV